MKPFRENFVKFLFAKERNTKFLTSTVVKVSIKLGHFGKYCYRYCQSFAIYDKACLVAVPCPRTY